MFSRFRIAFGFAFLLSLVFAIPVFAGGWAVITLDELPANVVAGQPLTIGFMVRQHGRTPMEGLYPKITATLNGDTQFDVYAKAEGVIGHYTATLTFPQEGDWNWTIEAFTMKQSMPTLNVVASTGQPLVRNSPAASPISTLLIIRMLAIAIGLFGLVVAYRRRSRLAVGLTVACLLIGIGSFITGSAIPKAEAQSKSSVLDDSSVSQVELGRELFIAKGCITCHVNSKAASSDYWTIEMGAPNLSKFSAGSEVLRLRLKDPTLVKADTQMPNLNLSDAEIEALIAFINSK